MQDGNKTPSFLRDLYRTRFKSQEESRIRVWRVLCERFFQHIVKEDATLLELAAGQCEFINNIKAKRKIAVDLNDDIYGFAGPNVEVLIGSTTDLSVIPAGSIDVVFVSNFLEHIPKNEIVITIQECYRVLRSGGQLIILQPNIRYCYKDYWMFFDHITPLDDRALCELVAAVGFCVTKSIPQFLPYTTKSKLPHSPFLVSIYLLFPILWRFFGAQALLIAER